jgi:cytochrome b561
MIGFRKFRPQGFPSAFIPEEFNLRPMEPEHRIEFSSAGKTLHWLIALLVLAELALGQWMSEAEGRELRRALLRLHQSNGLLIGALMVIRLAWRLHAQLPEWPASITPPRRKLLFWIEAILYLGMLAMPLAGLCYAMVGGLTISVFGWFEIPNLLRESDLWYDRLEVVHGLGARLLLLAILGHAGLVFYLNWRTSPGFLARMLPSAHRS